MENIFCKCANSLYRLHKPCPTCNFRFLGNIRRYLRNSRLTFIYSEAKAEDGSDICELIFTIENKMHTIRVCFPVDFSPEKNPRILVKAFQIKKESTIVKAECHANLIYQLLIGWIKCQKREIDRLSKLEQKTDINDEEKRMLCEISELISEAIKEKTQKNTINSSKLYKKAAKKQLNLAIKQEEYKNRRAISNLISAGFSALNSSDFSLISTIFTKLDNLQLNRIQQEEFEKLLDQFALDTGYSFESYIAGNINKRR